MAQLDRLIRDARKAMKQQGHVPQAAERWHGERSGATIDCAICHKSAIVLCRPHPNEINIGGVAIGESCNVATSLKLSGNMIAIPLQSEIRMDAVMGC